HVCPGPGQTWTSAPTAKRRNEVPRRPPKSGGPPHRHVTHSTTASAAGPRRGGRPGGQPGPRPARRGAFTRNDTMAARFRTDCEGFYRRDVLKLGAAGLLGLSLPDLLRLEARAKDRPDDRGAAKAKSVIMVWLAGGPATIDMWDLKPDAPEGIRGQFKPVAT